MEDAAAGGYFGGLVSGCFLLNLHVNMWPLLLKNRTAPRFGENPVDQLFVASPDTVRVTEKLQDKAGHMFKKVTCIKSSLLNFTYIQVSGNRPNTQLSHHKEVRSASELSHDRSGSKRLYLTFPVPANHQH